MTLYQELPKASIVTEDVVLVSFAGFEGANKELTEKLVPMVYELGFLMG